MEKNFSIEAIEVEKKQGDRFFRETVIYSVFAAVLCICFGAFGYIPQLHNESCGFSVLLWCRYNNAFYLFSVLCFAVLIPCLRSKADFSRTIKRYNLCRRTILFIRILVLLLGIAGLIGTLAEYFSDYECGPLTYFNLVYVITYTLFLSIILCIMACPFILLICLKKSESAGTSTEEFWRQF